AAADLQLQSGGERQPAVAGARRGDGAMARAGRRRAVRHADLFPVRGRLDGVAAERERVAEGVARMTATRAHRITDGELLHLAVCLAYQEVGIEATSQAWGRLSEPQRRFFEAAAREFLAARQARERERHTE